MFGLKHEKNRIREDVLGKRYALTEDEKTSADRSISSRLLSLASYRFADTVLFYYPVKNEPDILSCAEAALKAGKRIAFPLCNTESSTMVYKLVSSIGELKTGSYGIPEPPAENEEYLPSPDKHDLCIVPAVCYDRHGYRIGYGRGYYDRFLSGFYGTSVGLTMNRFLHDRLPRGKFDRAVDVIITEKGVISPK